jgi:hypothetical protein
MDGHDHDPFKTNTKWSILKPHFIPHFHVLNKKTQS